MNRNKQSAVVPVSVRQACLEALEQRTLMSVAAGSSLMVFSAVNGNTSPTQTLTVTNTGTASVTLGSGGLTIVDDPNVSTHDAGSFAVTNSGSVPATLAPNQSANLTINFTSPATGLHSAILEIQTNDPTTPQVNVALRALGTTGTGGGNEPSLAAILRAYEIPTIVGDGANDANAFSGTFYPNPPDASSQEVLMQDLEKAGTGPVTIQLLATFAVSNQPSTRFGYYTPGDSVDKTELFSVSQADAQTVHPTALGATTFDPGSANFGLYANFPTFTDNGHQRVAYSEDALNTWDSSVPRKIRFFPLENSDGTVVPDAYVFAAEDYNLQYDSNDVVGIIRNVKAAPAGPVLGIQNANGTSYSGQLAFNRVQIPNNDTTVQGDVVHDTNTLTLTNSGSQTLTISSVTLSDSANWQVVSAPSSIAPGATGTLVLKFVATANPSHSDNQTNDTTNQDNMSPILAGGVWSGTATIHSNDAVNPARTIQLAGYWQHHSEYEEEPSVQTIANRLFGYTTQIASTQRPQYPNSGTTPLYYGQEVSPSSVSGYSGYWQRSDSTLPVTVLQLAAYHSQEYTDPNTNTTTLTTAQFGWYAQGSSSTTWLFSHQTRESQSVLPTINGSNTNPAQGTFNPSGAFGFNVDGEKSDDSKNTADISAGRSGHSVRVYPAYDAKGNLIPNTYLVAQDYQNSTYDNSDYQDGIYLVTNIHPSTQPAAPKDLQVAGTSSGVQLQWAEDSSSVTYNVLRSTSQSGTYTQVNSSSVSATNYLDASATVGTTYYYKVVAVNGTNVQSPGSMGFAAALPADAVTLSAPANLAASAAISGITLTWDAVGGATGYNVLRAASASGPFTQVNGATLSNTTFVDTAAPQGSVSYYEVVAVNDAGTTSSPATISATRPSPQPTSTTLTFGGRTVATYTDALGLSVTLKLSGPGTGTAVFNGSDLNPDLITLDGTSGSSVFTVSAAGGTTTIGALTVNGSIKRIAANRALLAGDLTVNGTLAAAQLAGASGVHTFSIQGAGGSANLNLGQVSGLSLNSDQAVSVLQANMWSAAGGAPAIAAPSIGRLLVGGDLDADLNVAGGGTALKNATIKGALAGGTWTVAGAAGQVVANGVSAGWAGTFAGGLKQFTSRGNFAGNLTAASVNTLHVVGDVSGAIIRLTGGTPTDLKTLSVTGSVNGSEIRSAGGIGVVTAAALVNSDVFAGVSDAGSALPASAADFTADAAIKTVKIIGRGQPFAVQGSNVAAASLGHVTFGPVNTDNGGVPFGLAAHSLASYVRKVDGTVVRWTAKMDPSLLTPAGDAVVRLL